MRLTTTEELVLRLVAQDGDYERLEWLIGELRESFPQSTQEKLEKTAKDALKALVSKGLVALYRQRYKTNHDKSEAEHEPLASTEWQSALDIREFWAPSYTALERLSAAPTAEGEKIYNSLGRSTTK